MSNHVPNSAKPIAFLCFGSTRPGSPQRRMGIFPREQLDVGRNDVKNLLGTEALTVSTHHLRLRCIVYEEDNDDDIAPLIYFRVLSFNNVELKRPDAGHNTGITISRGHGDILLSVGDVIKLTPDIFLQFQYHSSVVQRDALDAFQRAEAMCFADQFYLSGRRLGKGGHASVFIAIQKKTGKQFACKAVPLPETDEYARDRRLTIAQQEAKLLRERQDLAREYTILERLSHPNIISLEKVICATFDIYIFQELITGGDLLSYLDVMGPLSEPKAAAITLQLLKAVNYLHSNGIAHRDIKPENILMASWRDGTRVVLTDFGQSREVDGANMVRKNSKMLRMQTIVGTYGYTAPEIFQQIKCSLTNKGYSKTVDIWSIGCVTAALLSGDTLFQQNENDFANAKNPPSKSALRKRWDVAIIDKHHLWTEVSQRAKQFLKGCLAKDESLRFTAEQALAADWFTNKQYATELAAVYEQAIAGWEPRKQTVRLVEFIDTTEAVEGSSELDDSSPIVSQLKSKHFEGQQEPIVTKLPGIKKPTVAPPKPQAAAQPPMSRAGKQKQSTALALPKGFTLGSADRASESKAFADRTPYASTGPLSILQYAPPQTQYTIPTQPVFRQQDSISQSQSMLDEASQTVLLSGTAFGKTHKEAAVVDYQETQLYDAGTKSDRLRKKVCR